MSIEMRIATEDDYPLILPILRDADEDEERIRRLVMDGHHEAYLAYDGQRLVGSVVMHWREGEDEESEIEYVAVTPGIRGQGYGKAMIAAILTVARERQESSVLVGTDNTAFGVIAFYQKCGFRIDHIRRDFFSYIQPPLFNDGIRLIDMLVLRCSLDA